MSFADGGEANDGKHIRTHCSRAGRRLGRRTSTSNRGARSGSEPRQERPRIILPRLRCFASVRVRGGSQSPESQLGSSPIRLKSQVHTLDGQTCVKVGLSWPGTYCRTAGEKRQAHSAASPFGPGQLEGFSAQDPLKELASRAGVPPVIASATLADGYRQKHTALEGAGNRLRADCFGKFKNPASASLWLLGHPIPIPPVVSHLF
jgi:hypothetical protein